eukprot:c23560_g1_i1 orf=138-1154(-)
MTIAGFSALCTKPVLHEARPEMSRLGVVCRLEGTMGHDAAPAQQSTVPINKDPNAQSSIPASARLSSDGTTPPSPRLAFVYGTLKRGFGNHWLMEELMAGAHARFLGLACTKRRFPLVCGPFQVPFLLPSPDPVGHHVRGELYQVDSLAISRLDDLEGVGKGHYERRPIDIRLLPLSPDSDAQMHNGNSQMGMHAHQSVAHTHQSEQQSEQQSDMHTHESNGYTDESYLDVDVSSCCTLAGDLSSCRLYMDQPYLDDVDTGSLPALSSPSSGPYEYMRAEAYFACPSYGLQMADRAPHIPCYTEKEASTYVRRKDRPHNRTFLEHVHAWIEEKGLIFT